MYTACGLRIKRSGIGQNEEELVIVFKAVPNALPVPVSQNIDIVNRLGSRRIIIQNYDFRVIFRQFSG